MCTINLQALFTEKHRLMDNERLTAPPRLLGSSRLSTCLMVGVSLVMLYLLRVNLSLTLVCMVHKESNFSAEWLTDPATNETWYNESKSSDVNTSQRPLGEFAWTRKFEGYALSSYFYGYISTMILGGFLAGRFGGKHVLGTGLLISSIATILIPPAVRYNEYLIIVLRIIIGAASGVFAPVSMNLAGLWFAEYERTFLTSVFRSGVTVGIIVAYLLPALFCTIPFDNGWPLTFYFSGGIGVVFWVLWNLLVFSSPAQHPRIPLEERCYIEQSSGAVISSKPKLSFRNLVFNIVTSRAVWAICVADFTTQWFINVSSVTLPLYMADVHRFNVRQNGVFLLVPQLLTVVTSLLLASFGSSLLLIVLASTDYNQRYFAVVLLIIVTPMHSMYRSGYGVNVLDIAPSFSGEIFSVANSFGETSGILAPIAVGYLTTNGTPEEWRSTFYLSAALFAFGGLFFLVFAEGTIQPWAAEQKAEEISAGSPQNSAVGETHIGSSSSTCLVRSDDASKKAFSDR